MKGDRGGFQQGSGRATVTQCQAAPIARHSLVIAGDRARACGDRASLAPVLTQFLATYGRAWSLCSSPSHSRGVQPPHHPAFG